MMLIAMTAKIKKIILFMDIDSYFLDGITDERPTDTGPPSMLGCIGILVTPDRIC
jgi:hypothetical protein